MGGIARGLAGSSLFADFVLKTGGLFIRVVIVSENLRMSIDPDAELLTLLVKSSPSNIPGETKVEEMY